MNPDEAAKNLQGETKTEMITYGVVTGEQICRGCSPPCSGSNPTYRPSAFIAISTVLDT